MSIKTKLQVTMLAVFCAGGIISVTILIASWQLDANLVKVNLYAELVRKISALDTLRDASMVSPRGRAREQWESAYHSLGTLLEGIHPGDAEEKVRVDSLIRQYRELDQPLFQLQGGDAAQTDFSERLNRLLGVKFSVLFDEVSRLTVESQERTVASQRSTELIAIVVVLAMLVVSGGVLFYTSHKIARSILKLKEGTILISRGSLEYRVEIEGRDEIAELAAAFNRMAQNLDRGITERRNIEAALRESEERYRLIAENTADTIAVSDLDLKLKYVSPSVLRLRGFTAQETMAQSLDQILTPESVQKVRNAYAEQIALESDGRADPSRTTLLELEEYCRDGSTMWVELASSFLRDKDSRPIGILTVTRDITTRKRAEAARQLLASAVEQAAEMIVITDAAARIEYVNPAFETVTGYSREEVLGRNPRFLQSGEQDAAFYSSLWKTISNGQTWTGRIVNRKKDGTRYTENATISPVRDSRGAIASYVAVKHDVTRERQLEEQLRQAQKMESVGRLAGGVAHDFNNMLQVITSYGELALSQVGPGTPLHRSLQQIKKTAQRSAELTAQLLTFARKQTVRPKVLNLNDAIAGTLKMLRPLIGEDIDLLWKPTPEPVQVLIDPSQLDQILANLAANARDAIAGVGALTLQTGRAVLDEAYCALHAGSVPGAFVELAVSDNGSGMDSETLSHVFEPFFTTKGVGRGTGLGLATVYGIVKQNNGFINVYSEPGEGTTFKVYLPCAEGGSSGAPIESAADAPRRGTETVLIVEDEEALLEICSQMLESLGYSVLTAQTPAEAIRAMGENREAIQLVITDVVMPQMNGRELASQLRALRPGLRCLFMSGYTADVIAQRSMLEEGAHFISKPFSIRALAEKVREAVS